MFTIFMTAKLVRFIIQGGIHFDFLITGIYVYFFPLYMIFYYSARTIDSKNKILLIFSLLFYAWGEPKYILLLVSMTFITWIFSNAIEQSLKHANKNISIDTSSFSNRAAKFKKKEIFKKARLYLLFSCIINLGLLGIFKYTNFFIGNINSLLGLEVNVPNISLPIGISFYTFQLITYIVDVYRGQVPAQREFNRLLLYVGLFHQCIAGPIVRYKDISDEINNRKVTLSDMSKGINRFAVGLGKKVIIANFCGSIADQLLADSSLLASQAVVALWLGILMYMLQIYMDFSAYSDMAIGMGLMAGFHYKENFDYPYLSTSVSEFWRRWHISLGSFFRDYVYIPLGGNRKGTSRTYVNLLIVWLLTGLWHGASWNFVLWGLYFCIFIVLERVFLNTFFDKLPKIVSHAYLLIIVYFGWILFRFSNMSDTAAVLKGMFGLNGNKFIDYETSTLLINNIFMIIVAIVAVTPVLKNIIRLFMTRLNQSSIAYKMILYSDAVMPVIIIILSTMYLVSDSYNPFLYFQF